MFVADVFCFVCFSTIEKCWEFAQQGLAKGAQRTTCRKVQKIMVQGRGGAPCRIESQIGALNHDFQGRIGGQRGCDTRSAKSAGPRSAPGGLLRR